MIAENNKLHNFFDNQNTLNLNSGAIHIENTLGIKQRLAWLFLVWKAIPILKNYSDNDLDNTVVKIKVNLAEIKNSIKYDSTNNEYLKEILENLLTTKVSWNIFNKDKNVWGACTLLSIFEVESFKDKAICTYAFNPFIQCKLAKPNMYARINLLITKNITSKNSLAIYCLSLDYLDINKNYSEKFLTISDIKFYLGLKETDYKNSGDLYRWVIKSSELDINKNTDMNIKIEVKREHPENKKSKILGFKLIMSIKKDYLDNYKTKKSLHNSSLTLKENINEIAKDLEEQNPKIETNKIKIENDLLRKFIAENNISMSTKVIQEKIRLIKQSFNDKFEDYLIFLMNYTKEETKKNNIKNISGFFVSLLKDENQLENYLVYFQEKEIEKHTKQSKLKDLLEVELNAAYKTFLSGDFINFIVNNADRLEKDIIHILKSNLKKGDFFYDVVLPRHNNLIDKTLITDEKKGTRYFVTSYLSDYKNELNYTPWSFEEWKQKKVTEEYIKQLEKKLSI